MKRFIIAAVSAAALAMPAGASAQDVSTTAMAAPCTTPVAYCVNQYVASVQRIVAGQCTTPVMTCVQQAVATAFGYVDYATFLARYYTYYAIDQADDPPPIQQICNLIWGQDCAAALT